MNFRFHPDNDVNEAFRRLQNAMAARERITDRDSLLIFREADCNICVNGPQPSAIVLRWDNAISVDLVNEDIDDIHLLSRFTDSINDL